MFKNLSEDKKQFIKFGIIGCSNIIVDLAIYTLLNELLPINAEICSIISSTICMSISFIINRKWTFKNTDSSKLKQQIVLYFSVSLFSAWGVQSLLILLTKEPWFYLVSGIFTNLGAITLTISDGLAKLSGIFVATITNFVGYKFIVFRKSCES